MVLRMVLSVELSAPAPRAPDIGNSGAGGGVEATSAYQSRPGAGGAVGPLVLGFGSLEYLEQLRCHLQIAAVDAFIQVPMQAAGQGSGGVNGVDALHMAGQFAYLSQNCLQSCLGVCQPGLAGRARGLLDQLEGRADGVELVELNLPMQVERLYRLLLSKQASQLGQVVFVCGAVGGIGATYSAALLAWAGRELIRSGPAPALAQLQGQGAQPDGPGFGAPAPQAPASAALVDANPYGGLDLYLGSAYCQGASWGQLPKNQSPLWPQRLVRGLGKYHGVKVLAGSGGQGGPKNWQQMSQAIYSLRTTCQLTVVDLPALQLAHLPWDELEGARVLLVSDLTRRVALAARGWLQEVRPGLGALALREQGADLTSQEIARLVGAPVVCALPNRRELSQRLQLGLDPLRLKRAEKKVGARLANWALNPNFWAQKGKND